MDAVLTVEQELAVTKSRLLMARAYAQMVQWAYDALLSHGVNYRTLKETDDESLLEEAKAVPLREGEQYYLQWMERVTNAITAAVRRKGFKPVT